MKRKTPASESRAVEDFNRDNPIGTPVTYWPGVRVGDGVDTKTRSHAQLLSGHTAVVWVEGRGDCQALSHIKIRKTQ